MLKFIAIIMIALLAGCEKKQNRVQHEHNGGHKMLQLSPSQRRLANIKIDTARFITIFEEMTLTGTATADEKSVAVISSRVKGRVDKLFVRNPGMFIRPGDPLYSIYSEELLAFENEYLLAIEQNTIAATEKSLTQQMVDAARRRLQLWTLSEKQIAELEKTKLVSPFIIFYSQYSGFLTELMVREGEYVEAGSAMFLIEDLKTLWIETQLYSHEVNALKQSPTVEVEFEAFPEGRVAGEIVYNNPRLEENSNINLVRIKVRNEKGTYKPGMMAYVRVKRNKKVTLAIPKSALLLEGAPTVWVEKPDGMFEPRVVETGISNKHSVEIVKGISEGELVVSSGAYLLNSEWKVRMGGAGMQHEHGQ